MKAVVLSSGGVDSTTCVAMAVNELGSANVVTLSFKYGQRHEKELESAQKIADFYGLAHYVYDLTSIFAYSDCSLLSSSKEKPEHMSYADQIARDGEGKVSTYVPFQKRTDAVGGSRAGPVALSGRRMRIWIGAHADDAAGNAYADCSVAFNESMGRAISIGTYELVKLHAPLNRLNKAQVVAEGLKLGVPYDLTWSCYEGGEKACGKCATCIDRLAAFRANGCEDPIDYED